MNAERAKKFLPLIAAVAEGKTIQVRGKDGNWYETHLNDFDPDRYRVKPEQRTFDMWLYRPTGRMYPFVEGECFTEDDEWERITVTEVLK